MATLPGLAIQSIQHLTLKARHSITNNAAGEFDPVVSQTLSSNKVLVKSIHDMTSWVQEIDSSYGCHYLFIFLRAVDEHYLWIPIPR